MILVAIKLVVSLSAFFGALGVFHWVTDVADRERTPEENTFLKWALILSGVWVSGGIMGIMFAVVSIFQLLALIFGPVLR